MKRLMNIRIDDRGINLSAKCRVLGIHILLVLFVFSTKSYAHIGESEFQVQTIAGTITDADNLTLPGVNVLLIGTSDGTITDLDGNYSIDANVGDVLQFSFIGMQTQRLTVGSSLVMDVVMASGANALDEIVVVGYGTKKRRDVTSSVSQISSKELTANVQTSAEFALQGTTPGILVQSASGDPNARPNIRIRGVGTLGFNDPLYVIDGVPVSEFGAGVTAFASPGAANDIRGSQNILNLINPSDIASISVLKDAAATAVYGMRASNGVILIETKRGQGKELSFSFSARRGVRNIREKFSTLNTAEYTSYLTESYNNAGVDLPPFLDPSASEYLGRGGETYDWQSAVENSNALTEDYSISAQSGSERANFFFSGAISNQESTLKYNKLKRYSGTLTSDFKVSDWLKVGESLRLTYSENDDSKNVGGFNLISEALKPAWQPIFDSSDPTGFAKVRDEAGNLLWGQPANGGTGVNGLAVGQLGSDHYNILRNLGSVYAEISPIEGLRVRGTLGLDWNNINRQRVRSKRYVPYHVNSPNQTDFLVRDLNNWSVLTELLASYTKKVDQHSLEFLVNISKQNIGTDWTQVTAVNPIFDDPERVALSPSDSQNGQSFKDRKKLSGSLFKFSYNYASKYYLDASYRRDGSSVFAPGNRFGNFYGLSAAWRLSDEAFIKDATWIDDLKVRGSWGQTGNQETLAFSYLATISLNPRLSTSNNSFLTGIFQRNIPNTELSWETSTTTNFGIDLSALDYKLNLSLEYYSRLTADILQPFPLPITIGFRESPVVNLAEVSNKGIELALNWTDQIGSDIEYNVGFNLTTVKNEVIKLTEEAADGRILQSGFYGTQVGRSIGFIYGYQMDGIFQNQAEVDAWKAQFTDEAGSQADISPGDVRFADLFGNPGSGEFRSDTPDGVINANDRTELGKTIPGYYYGINLGAKYKNFDLSMQWQGVGDVQKVNRVRISGESLNANGSDSNQFASVSDRWTSSNPSTTLPRALYNDPVRNTRFSSRFVEDASYLRLQNLQIGYSLNEGALEKIGIQNLRLYISGNNPMLITGYSGLDPEVNIFSDTDFNPPPTVWLFGVDLTF